MSVTTVLRVAAVIAVLAAGSVSGAMVARADPGNSDAAHMCLDGLQWDYYAVVAGDPESVDFGGLTHGFDEEAGSHYVEASSHGECVSFFAKNKGDGNGKANIAEITITKVVDKSTPDL